jgi:uncharacterized membrane protein
MSHLLKRLLEQHGKVPFRKTSILLSILAIAIGSLSLMIVYDKFYVPIQEEWLVVASSWSAIVVGVIALLRSLRKGHL